MIDPIFRSNQVSFSDSPSKLDLKQKENLLSCISSLGSSKPSNLFLSFLSWLFNPIIRWANWVYERISISTSELEAFEDLGEDALKAVFSFVYEEKKGKKQIEQVMQNALFLHESLSKKWFPHLEALWFTRGNLLKLNIRLAAILGDRKKVKEYEEALSLGGYAVKQELKDQINLILTFAGPEHEKVRICMNILLQTSSKLYSKFNAFHYKLRGRRGSNPQLPP